MEHSSLTGASLHEPKGVESAASNRVYVADGTGTGNWKKISAASLEGTVGNTQEAGRVVTTDGQGGFSSISVQASYGSLTLTNNAAPVTVPAASDGTLGTNTDYVELTLNFGSEDLKNLASGSNFLEIVQAGNYRVDFWCNLKSDSSTSTVAFKFVVNDSTFVTRRPKVTTDVAGRLTNVSASGIANFPAGAQIKMYIACNESAQVTIEDLALSINLLETASV